MNFSVLKSPSISRPPQVPTKKTPARFISGRQSQPFSYLPELLLQLILAYLEPKELGRISAVDKQMNIESSTVAEFCALKILREVFASDYQAVLQRLLNSQPSISYKKFLNDLRKKRVLVLNGTSKHSAMFDIKANKWSPCSTEMTQHRAAFSSVWFRGELVVISGNVPDIATGSVEKYNPFTDTWTSLPALPQRLRYASGAVLHNQLYIIGGFNKTSGVASNAVYRYETSTESNTGLGYWNLIDIPLPVARYTHAAVGFDGKIWVAGGFPKPTSVQVYDPALGDWSEAPPLMVRRAQFKLLVVGGDLYAVGGDDATTNKTTIEKFDRRLQAWSIIATLKEQRLMMSTCAAGSKIYIFGGMVSSTKALETWDSFDVRTLSWESDAHLIDNDFVDFEDDVEDDDDCYVGYDVDSDVDVDMEMTAANSPQVKERVSPGGGGRGDLSSRCRTPLVKSVSPFLASQARTGHLGHTPLMASISSAPIDCATSSSSSSSVFVASSSSSSSSVASPSLSIQTPCATRTPTVLRRSNSSCEKEGQIMLAVPNSLKRSLSSSNTPLCQLSGSFQRSPLEDSPLPIAPTPLRSKAFSDAVRGPLSMGSPSIALEDESPLSARPVRRVKRRVRRPTRVARDRGLPFAHAFGCAITIPAICLYS